MQPEFRDALFIASDYSQNFKQIIAKRPDLTQFDSGRMVAPTSGNPAVTYEAGLVLGVVTSSGKYAPYNASNSDGTQTAVGILAEQATMDSSGAGSLISIIREGTLFKDLLIGLDSGAITSLGGHSFVEGGINLIRIRA